MMETPTVFADVTARARIEAPRRTERYEARAEHFGRNAIFHMTGELALAQRPLREATREALARFHADAAYEEASLAAHFALQAMARKWAFEAGVRVGEAIGAGPVGVG